MTSLPKAQAIEIEFSDGSKVIVHEPLGREGLRIFLSAMPALTVLQRIFAQIQDIEKGLVTFSNVDIPDEVIEAVHKLLGVMSDITPEQFEKLSVSNQIALLRGFSLFAPKKTLEATPLPEAGAISTTPLTN